MNIKNLILVSLVALFFSACTQQVAIKALQPAEVARMANNKDVAVTSFRRDNLNLSSKIESALSSKIIDGKPFFKLVSRKNINKIIAEQKLQANGLIDTKSSISIGTMTGAKAIINGEISSRTMNDSNYWVERRKCVPNTKCKKTYVKKIRCKKRVIGLGAALNIVDTSLGEVIYSKSFTPTKTYTSCQDRSSTLPTKRQGLETLATQIANEFTSKLAPYYITFKVSLMEDVEFDVTDKQKQNLKNALEFIKLKRYEKSLKILTMLSDELQGKSYAVLYDLALTTEALGDLQGALDLYKLAEDTAGGPNKLISTSIGRVQSTIDKRKQALAQINNK